MKSVLLLTDFYVPNPSANGICVEKVAKQLVKDGHRVYVLAYGIGNEKDNEVIDGINVIRVRAPLFFQIREHNRNSRIMKMVFAIARFFRFVQIALFLPWYPLSFPVFALKYKNCAIDIVKKRSIDCVIAEYMPIEAMYTLLNMKKKYPHVCKQAFIVDTFTQCPNANNYRVIYKLSLRWEKRVIAACDNYFYLESFSDYYGAKSFETYKGKMQAIGLPLIEEKYIKKKESDDEIRMVYTGSWGGERNPRRIMEIVNGMKYDGKKISFIYYGKYNSLINSLEKEYTFVKNGGFVQSGNMDSVYETADVLVNIGNSTDMLPSKLFAYMSTGLPILHFYLYKEDPCVAILEKYKNATILDLKNFSREQLLNALHNIIGKKMTYKEIVENYHFYEVKEVSNILVRDC